MKDGKDIQAVFFDLDGTLFDTEPDILTSYLATFDAFGVAVDREKFRIGPPLGATIRLLRPEITEAELKEVAGFFAGHYDGSGFPTTRPYPGVEEVLTTLAERGIPLFVATNKRRHPAELLLAKFDWARFFRQVYTSDMQSGGPLLSKAGMLELALREHGFEPGATWMVGDTAGDIEAAHRTGMRSCAVSWGYAKPGEWEQAKPEAVVTDGAAFLRLLQQ